MLVADTTDGLKGYKHSIHAHVQEVPYIASQYSKPTVHKSYYMATNPPLFEEKRNHANVRKFNIPHNIS
jgi:hypothetical protein